MECTVNRVGATWYDQVEQSGHGARLDDLERFAELGLRVLRYPVLWERTAPRGLDRANWEWSDIRLERLRQLDIDPVLGLLHHGAGPDHVDILDQTWPERMAEYAAAVATRYPWISAFTPVNEPLTTARFSALYGYWYPHLSDDRAFARVLVNQVKAVALAMQRIREVTPGARLIQTEDLAFISATPGLTYQATFENERRWVTMDLLIGRLRPGMPMHHWLQHAGIALDELQWFEDHPTPPDIMGWNYYVLSERRLEEDAASDTGNGRHRYRDRDAARTCGLRGLRALLVDAYQRFRIPMAVTESHLGGTRDEQLRWLVESWEETRRAQRSGVDIRGFTAWSLLGAYDWDSLCTRCSSRYEPGAFDVRGSTPRPTALAAAVRQLVAGERPDHPVLDAPGWWHS
jgi:dTDP-4-dehydrorhamnose reductase